MEKYLTEKEATEFFSRFYGGEHHIPGYKVRAFGNGWFVNHDRGPLATYDFNQLTRLVIAAHDECIRVEIAPVNFNMLRIAIWKRDPNSNDICIGHPTMDQAIDKYMLSKPALAV